MLSVMILALCVSAVLLVMWGMFRLIGKWKRRGVSDATEVQSGSSFSVSEGEVCLCQRNVYGNNQCKLHGFCDCGILATNPPETYIDGCTIHNLQARPCSACGNTGMIEKATWCGKCPKGSEWKELLNG